MRNFGKPEKEIGVPIPVDAEGYLGRECPNPKCEQYFKITPGTGLSTDQCNCPYCGHKAHFSHFHTKDQIDYASSVAIQSLLNGFEKELKKMEFDIKPKGDFGIGIGLKVKSGSPIPLKRYQEKQLETKVECSKCGLKYAVYGVFAFCPDCGEHNSLQMLIKSLEVIQKILEVSKDLDSELTNKLIENSLEDCVAAFDGFGRELFNVNAKKANDEGKAKKVSFQNIENMQRKSVELFNIDPQNGLPINEWEATITLFQKRHLLSHTMGVIDADYIHKSKDKTAIIGRKVKIGKEDVIALCGYLEKIANYLVLEMAKLK